MAEATRQHAVIINRNYPPRAGVTGESARALAANLQDSLGVRISVVTVRSKYAGGGSKTDPIGQVYEIRSWYEGKNKFIRLFSNFIESFFLIWKARKIQADSWIVMTDPPFLSFWAARFLRKKKWGLWCMDLYPDAFCAGNLVSNKNAIYKLSHRLVYGTPPRFLVALGDLQADYLSQKYQLSIATAILPCGVFTPSAPEALPEWKTNNSDKILLGYCGNLGEAHSVEFLHAVITHLDTDRFHLILSVYGSKAPSFLKEIDTEHPGITLVDNVTRNELGLIDVHLVSLLSQWVHVCVPSKAVSAVCAGSSFLFYGIQQCDNWDMLGEAGWIVDETCDQKSLDQQVASRLNQINEDNLREKKKHAKTIAESLRAMVSKSYQEIGQFVTSSVPGQDNNQNDSQS